MLKELHIDLTKELIRTISGDPGIYGKALAVRRVIEAEDPAQTVYLTGYTPLAASNLGFAGKMNLYGVSLLGGNLQGSRSGGLAARYLSSHGIPGVKVTGESERQFLLHIDPSGESRLVLLSEYGEEISGTFDLAARLYARHGDNLGLAITDPGSLGFLYNALVCNSKRGAPPSRAAARGTTVLGRNGLIGLAVEQPVAAVVPPGMNDEMRRQLRVKLRALHKRKWNTNLSGSARENAPLLGGTYGGAAKARFMNGHGLTDLFRGADVPPEHLAPLLPETIVRQQVELAAEHGLKISRHSCMPGCPNRCSQTLILPDGEGGVEVFKAGEWETYQGVINLGIFRNAARTAAWVLRHSNDYAYDHIEALGAVAALALATEQGHDAGARYGDEASIIDALEQAAAGSSDLGLLLRQGAAAVEQRFGLPRHFTIGGHGLPLHNGRSLLQTGVGMSWTYGRHGESCAGPGRQNFLGAPYDPTDHTRAPEEHVLNTVHGMILYGALDEHGSCFFIGPSIDTLVDAEALLQAMGVKADAAEMIRAAACTIKEIHAFNASRGVHIQPLPDDFYEVATRGNAQSPEETVAFNVPFEVIRDYGARVLDDVASGEVTVPAELLKASRARYA